MPAASSPTELLKATVAQRGLNAHGLAAKVGISPKTAQMVLWGHLQTSNMQRRIEYALDVPIWSSSQDFHRRRAVAEWLKLGRNPFTMPVSLLRGAMAVKGVTLKDPLSRASVDAQLFAAFDALKEDNGIGALGARIGRLLCKLFSGWETLSPEHRQRAAEMFAARLSTNAPAEALAEVRRVALRRVSPIPSAALSGATVTSSSARPRSQKTGRTAL